MMRNSIVSVVPAALPACSTLPEGKIPGTVYEAYDNCTADH